MIPDGPDEGGRAQAVNWKQQPPQIQSHGDTCIPVVPPWPRRKLAVESLFKKGLQIERFLKSVVKTTERVPTC